MSAHWHVECSGQRGFGGNHRDCIATLRKLRRGWELCGTVTDVRPGEIKLDRDDGEQHLARVVKCNLDCVVV